jgi:membrane-bound lytic murein transglycosylase D
MRKNSMKTATSLVAGIFIGASILTLFSFKDSEKTKEKVIIKEVTVEEQNHGQLQYKWHSPELPAQLSFAGEAVPMQKIGIKEQLDRELMYNYYNQTTTAFILKMANRWFPVIEPILAANGVPDDFKYLCVAESALKNQTSPVGATGFWQFMPRTAPEFGLEVRSEVDERYNVAKSTEAAAKYFKQAYNKFHSWTSAAASYNMGQGGLHGQSVFQKQQDYYSLVLPEETMRYVHRILAFKLLIGNPDKYGFHLNKDEVYEPIETRVVAVKSSIPNLAEFAIKMGTSYKALKELNPWLREKKLTVKKGKSYEIALPADDRV